MVDSDHVIAKIAEFFKNRGAKMALDRIYTSLEGSKFEYIQMGIKNHLANPDNEQWQDFIQDLFIYHTIYPEDVPILRKRFNAIGISLIEKRTYNDSSSFSMRMIVEIAVDFVQPSFSVEEKIQSVKKIIPLNFPSDLNIHLETVLMCLSQVYIIENSFRLVMIELENKGSSLKFTNKIKEQINNRKDKEKDWIPLRGDHDLFWTTLGELIKIFKSHNNQEQFQKVGLSQSRMDDIISILKSIEPFRNVSAHFPLYFPRQDYVAILNGEWTKFKRLMEGIQRDKILDSSSF